MKLGSLFDGSGGFPLSGYLCGIEPVWASEIEPYPIAVTKSRFPKQMLTWYNKLHTDSAEYKMWGNGIALPCALFVMQGIEEGERKCMNV